MATAFENFVNTELPKRIATNESPTTPQAGDIPIYTGVGLLTESKTPNEAGLATETFATNAANTAETNAKSYADGLITSIYKFQTTYDPQTTGQFPTTANTVGGVAIKKGFTWVVSGITGQYTFQGVTVDNGDTLLALVDNASATSAADWHITEKNLGYTPENQSNKVNNLTDSTSTTKYTSVKAVVDGLATKEPAIAAGTTAQYLRGDKTWQTLNTDAVPETANHVYLSPAQKTIATQAATATLSGYLSSTDWNTFNGKQAALVSGTNIKTVNGSSLLGSGDLTVESGVIVVQVASGTVTLAANKNYLILASGNFTLNTASLSAGYSVELWNVSPTANVTVTFAAPTLVLDDGVPYNTVIPNNLTSLAFRVGERGYVTFVTNASNTAQRYVTKYLLKAGSNTPSSNTLAGTDVALIASTGSFISNTHVVGINLVSYDILGFSPVQKAGIVLGSSTLPIPAGSFSPDYAVRYGGALGAVQCLFMQVRTLTATSTTHNVTFDGSQTLSDTNCAKLKLSATSFGSAVHDVDLIVTVDGGDGTDCKRVIFAKRRVFINTDATSSATTSTITVGTDVELGVSATASITIAVTVDTVNNRLIPTVSGTSGSGQNLVQASCRITSHYSRKA